MAKIKLAVLAIALLIGFVGAYGASKRTTNVYWIAPGTPLNSLTALISAGSPTLSCSGGTAYPFLCRISTGETYFPGDEVWITEVTVISTYNQ
jgi:hypothetical protein